MPSKVQRPRLCVLEKGDNGYGFHLHGEKGKSGQFIRLVEPDSPAELSGLRAGDRLVLVNGERVEGDSHQQVVSRIRASAGNLELVVVDPDTDELLRRRGLKCVREFVSEGIPGPDDADDDDAEFEDDMTRIDTPSPPPVPERNGEMIPIHVPVETEVSPLCPETESEAELRPRLCVIRKGFNGFGFNLHSDKSRPGQYIRAIDEDSPAERSGLRPQDRIVQVNGRSVEGKQHSEVVAAIKASGDETALLVVDPDTDAFFRKCQVKPTADHLTGALPEEPVLNGDLEDKVNGNMADEVRLRGSKFSVSPTPSNASSSTSLVILPTETTPTGTPSIEAVEASIIDAIPELNLSLQQVKERAHQKRSNKRAPPMDWSKKNELFSNL